MWRCLFVSLLCMGSLLELTRGQQDPQFFDVPATCGSDADCGAVKPDSRCVATTIQDGAGNSSPGNKCACLRDHGWQQKNDQSRCVKQVAPMDACLEGERSICVDPGSHCVLEGSNSDARRCYCKSGYVTAQKTDDPNEFVCGAALSVTQDPNCQGCANNGGKCYDTNGDGLRDGCQCMLSQTGPDCENFHLTVSCTGEAKSICYGPNQTGVDFSTGSRLFADGYGDNVACVGKVLTVGTATANCQAGYNLLVLPLTADQRDTCGTKEVAANGDARLETLVTVTRSTGNFDFHFKTYCTFQRKMESVFNGIGVIASQGHVSAAAGNDRGQTLKPQLDLAVQDEHGTPLGDHPTMRSGDKVKFIMSLTKTDPVIYSAIKVSECMFSTKGSIDLSFHHDNNENTKQVITAGCPTAGQAMIDRRQNWKRDPMGHANVLETGQIKMFKFPSSDLIFLHCNVILCTPGNEAQCQASTCEGGEPGFGRRRKRAATEIDNGSQAVVATSIKFVDDDNDGTAAKSTGGVGALTTGGFVGTVVVMVAVLIAFVVLALFLLWRIKNKEAKVMDHQPGKPQNFALPRMERNQNI